MYCNFYGDDITIVSSLVLTTKSVSAVFCPAGFFYNTQVLNSNVSLEKRERGQQANVFKRQTSTFHFPNSFKHLSHHTLIRLHERINCCDRCIGRRNNTATRLFLTNNTFLTTSKRLHQTYIAVLIQYLLPYIRRISN